MSHENNQVDSCTRKPECLHGHKNTSIDIRRSGKSKTCIQQTDRALLQKAKRNTLGTCTDARGPERKGAAARTPTRRQGKCQHACREPDRRQKDMLRGLECKTTNSRGKFGSAIVPRTRESWMTHEFFYMAWVESAHFFYPRLLFYVMRILASRYCCQTVKHFTFTINSFHYEISST